MFQPSPGGQVTFHDSVVGTLQPGSHFIRQRPIGLARYFLADLLAVRFVQARGMETIAGLCSFLNRQKQVPVLLQQVLYRRLRVYEARQATKYTEGYMLLDGA